jgi:hypothetical protein
MESERAAFGGGKRRTISNSENTLMFLYLDQIQDGLNAVQKEVGA